LCRLEMTSVVCFVGVAAISNRLVCRLAFSLPSYAEAPEGEPSIGKAPERGRFHARGVEFSGGATHFFAPVKIARARS